MACEICKKPYVTPEDISFDGKPHVCKTCGKGFSLKVQLKRHMQSHEGGVPYVCNTCENQDNQYNLRLSKKGNFTCETCNKTFSTQRMLLRHASEHTFENVIDCDECDESFKNANLLKKHAAAHRSKTPLLKSRKKVQQAANSVKEFQVTGAVKTSRKSSAAKTYQCIDCSEIFTDLQVFEKHCLSHKYYKCDSCSADFCSKLELDKHCVVDNCKEEMKSNCMPENSGSKKHVCVLCSKTFTRKSALEGHMLSHLTDKNESAVEDDSDKDVDFMCNIRSEKSEQSKELCLPKLKIRRSFPCEKCEMVCASKKILEKHLSSHQTLTQEPVMEQMKTYVCRICNEKFLLKEDYKKHKASHSLKLVAGIDSETKVYKTYTCKVCSKVFQKKKHLKKHIKNHPVNVDSQVANAVCSNESPRKKLKRSKNFACEVCGKRFAGETCLKKHEARHNEGGKDDPLNKEKKSKQPQTLICSTCNEDFTGRKHAYIKHKLSHTPEVCGICDARFADRPGLREHLKTHIGTEEARRFIECSQKALHAKSSLQHPDAKVEYIYLVLR